MVARPDPYEDIIKEAEAAILAGNVTYAEELMLPLQNTTTLPPIRHVAVGMHIKHGLLATA